VSWLYLIFDEVGPEANEPGSAEASAGGLILTGRKQRTLRPREGKPGWGF
jgi:hypothetical protein